MFMKILFPGAAIYLCMSFISCTQPQNNTSGADSLKVTATHNLSLKDISNTPGSSDMIISYREADSMVHDFDIFFRNPDGYNHYIDAGKHDQWRPNKNYSSYLSSTNYSGIFDSTLGHGNIAVDADNNVTKHRANDSLSQSVWFGKELIELLSDSLINNKNLDGVRIYYAAYRDSTNKSKFRMHRLRQSTLILVPTYQGSPDPKGGFYHHDDFIFQHVRENGLSTTPITDGGGSLNHGQLCPYNCN